MPRCACGADTTPNSDRCRRCACRAAQARYQRTEKGRAAFAKYKRTAKGIASNARYRHSLKGTAAYAKHNQRRIFIGRSYHGRAQNTAQAAVIRSYIQERVREFKQRFAHGEETQGATQGQVPPEATV